MATYTFETEEHAALRAEARRWAARELAPHALAWDAEGEFPRAGHSVGAVVGLGSLSIALPPLIKLGTVEQHARFVAPARRHSSRRGAAPTSSSPRCAPAGPRTVASRCS